MSGLLTSDIRADTIPAHAGRTTCGVYFVTQLHMSDCTTTTDSTRTTNLHTTLLAFTVQQMTGYGDSVRLSFAFYYVWFLYV